MPAGPVAPVAPVAPIEVMVMSNCAAWPVSSFSLESRRMAAVTALSAMPLLLEAEVDPALDQRGEVEGNVDAAG